MKSCPSNRRSCVLVGAWLVLLAAGCSQSGLQTIPVEGTVMLDGQPVSGAGVMFMPDDQGPPATGTTDAQGHFALRTSEQDGATPGEHRVTVTLQKTSGVAVDESGLEAGPVTGPIVVQWIVPEKYSKPATSGLTAKVAVDGKPFAFELSSK